MNRLGFLRSRAPLLALAQQFTRMRHYGRTEHVGLCPFHVERHPSFFVNVETGRFHCFGCEAGGDVFRFVEILCACDFREAVRQVARIANGKPLSVPPVGLASLPHRCQGWCRKGLEAPSASDRAERLRAAREAHGRAVAIGAARAALARYDELPASMRADWDAALLLVKHG